MSLLTASIVRENNLFTGIYFIFLRTTVDQTSKPFNTKFEAQWRDEKTSYKVK